MTNPDLVSEEKLLRLIRKKDPAAELLGKKPSSGPNLPAVFIADPLTWGIRGFFLLALCLAVVLAQKIYNYRDNIRDHDAVLAAPIDKTAPTAAAQNGTTFAPPAAEPVPDSGRDIFVAAWEQPAAAASPSPDAAAVFDIAKKYKLIGIILDKTPIAMIQDLQVNKTMTISKGATVADMTLEEINENFIVFRRQDQRIELRR
ncbi:MAG: hypothetical protein HQL23_08180 [Candidatus Omnitrophica bacterium]|nr:hypothetical protein [Candidatus Omnitrophota bacterium]